MPCIGSPVYVHHYNVCPSCKSMVLLTHVHLITVLFSAKLIPSHSPPCLVIGNCCKVFYLALSLLYCALLDPFL